MHRSLGLTEEWETLDGQRQRRFAFRLLKEPAYLLARGAVDPGVVRRQLIRHTAPPSTRHSLKVAYDRRSALPSGWVWRRLYMAGFGRLLTWLVMIASKRLSSVNADSYSFCQRWTSRSQLAWSRPISVVSIVFVVILHLQGTMSRVRAAANHRTPHAERLEPGLFNVLRTLFQAGSGACTMSRRSIL